MKIAFYYAKDFEKPQFEAANAELGHEIHYIEAALNSSTAPLAKGCDAVCIFVNDKCDAATVDQLAAGGVKLILCRSAGGETVADTWGFAVKPTISFEAALQADVLVVPGGPGQIEAIADGPVLDFVRRQGTGAKWVTSVCMGALILGGLAPEVAKRREPGRGASRSRS